MTQKSDPKVLSGHSLVMRRSRSLVQIFDLEVVVPLREVEVAFVPFDLATLEINSVAARVLLLGIEIATEIGVDDHSVRLDATEEEIAAVGGDSETLIHRNPTITFEIDFAPVVEVAGSRVHHQAALPSGRNPFVAAHRDEQQRHLAAVAVVVRQDIFRNILDCGIVSGRCPRECLVDPGVDRLGLKVRVVDS